MSGEVAKIEQVHTPAPAHHNEADAILSMIERAARDTSVDVDKFERLMAMQERVEAKLAVRAFNDAVASAKGEFGSIAKNRTVDFTSQKGRTNYRHEDFSSIASVVDPVLARHGLSYRFRSAQSGSQKITVTCILSHRRGHSEETTLESGEDHSGNKNSTQAIGSAATYLQRYTLKLALGLASSHDDDGQKAGGEPPTAATVDEIEALITATSSNRTWFLQEFSVETLDDLNGKQRDRCKAMLVAKQKKMGAGK